MRKSRSSGSVGERGGNDPLYPDIDLRLSIKSGYRWSRASVFPLLPQQAVNDLDTKCETEHEMVRQWLEKNDMR